MLDWWNGLDAFSHVVAIIAIASSVLLVIQIILLLFGIGNGGDIDFDVSVSDVDEALNGIGTVGGIKLLSIRTTIAFLAVGAWTVLWLNPAIGPTLSIIIGIIAGAIVAVLMAYAIKSFNKFETSGNIEPQSMIGAMASVYIPVPKNGEGKGKVNVTINDRIIEMDAITQGDVVLARDSMVKVVEVVGDSTLVVEKA